MYDAGGPLWWRGLAENQDERTVCGWASELKTKLGVRRVIGGHTPNFERIVDRCNASIIIIDTGISSAYGGVLSALEIVYTLTPMTPSPAPDHRQDPLSVDGAQTYDYPDVSTAAEGETFKAGQLYWEREEVHAVYERRRHLITIEEREVVL